MRILHVDSARSWRGGQNQVLLTALGQAELGHEVRLVCRAGGVLAERARAAGLACHPVAFHGDLSPLAVSAVRRILADWKPQVAQMHDPHALAAGRLAALGASGAPRLVATRRVDFAVSGGLSRWKYRGCHRIVAVSRAIAQVLQHDGFEADRVRVVYEGVPDRPPVPGGAAALQALGVPAGAAVIGNVAALSDHKDHATLLDAVALVMRERADAWLVVVGDGELRATLERRAIDLGIAARCVFAGFRDDVDRLHPAFDVFCLSSHMEGLGTSVLDAMCFARPVVATAAGGIPEAVEDGVTGRIVPVRDPGALASALLEVLVSRERAAALGDAGRRRFEALFTTGRMVAETLAVYEEIT